MKNNNLFIPLHIIQLIVGFFQETLTENEHFELDDWISVSNDNMRAFEACLEMSCRPYLPNPDNLDEKERQLYNNPSF